MLYTIKIKDPPQKQQTNKQTKTSKKAKTTNSFAGGDVILNKCVHNDKNNILNLVLSYLYRLQLSTFSALGWFQQIPMYKVIA